MGNRDELLPRCYARLRLLPLRLDPPRPLLLIRLLLHIHVLELILVEHPRAQRGTHSRGGQPAGAQEDEHPKLVTVAGPGPDGADARGDDRARQVDAARHHTAPE